MPAEIGGYRIFGRLGEGGMGVVYEAEQPSPRRRVALKVIRGTEIVDDLRLKMFEREAATLGLLHHPNIGAIYESGRTPEGRHFFAMELVRGATLADWLASRPKSPDRAEIELRLRLFRQICDAVHYAHQRGVIHRDLKPSNVIVTDTPASGAGSGVTPSPMVKILDFGLARITEGDVAATQVTEVGVIKGTLPYMAPEQARGDASALDVRTDVYALGVMLYELLTGQRPYSVETGSLLSAVKVICEQAPKPLAETWRASVRLDPDLATIVMTALQKEPDQRYASAAAFGDDVGRLLTSQPILARAPSTMYQLKKLVARRKPLFATVAAGVVLVIAAAIGMGVLYVRSVAAEQSARREAETAQRTSDFLVELFDGANPERTRGESVTARAVMDEGARRVGTELKDDPVLQARLMSTIGQVYLSLGLYDDAQAQIDQALALRQQNLPAGDIAIAASEVQRGTLLEEKGDREGSRAAFEKAIAMYEALGPAGRDGLIDTNGQLGYLLSELGQVDEATRVLDRALSLAETREPRDDARVLKILNNQASLLTTKGLQDSSLVVLGEALELSRRVYGDDHYQTGRIYTNMSVSSGLLGKYDVASDYSLKALAIYKKTYGEYHPWVSKELGNEAILLAQQGKFAEARPYFEESLQVLAKIYGPDHPEVAQAYMNLGLSKLQGGDVAGATSDLEHAIAIHERNSPEPTMSLGLSLYHLAGARAASGQWNDAHALMLRALAIDEKLFGPESTSVADDLEAIAGIEREMGRVADAERTEKRMNDIRAKNDTAGATE